MKHHLALSCFLLISVFSKAQTTTRYFNSEYLEKEVSKERAKFEQRVTQNPDGIVTTEILNVKTQKVIKSETYKDKEPYGEWRYMGNSTPLNFNFPLIYSNEGCLDTIPGFAPIDYLTNNEAKGYIAPKISNSEVTIYQSLTKNIIYPAYPRDNDIQGKVYLTITVSTEGLIERVVVNKGVEIHLDKEAVRVVKQLKFSSPAFYKGQKHRICFVMPVVYKLQ